MARPMLGWAYEVAVEENQHIDGRECLAVWEALVAGDLRVADSWSSGVRATLRLVRCDREREPFVGRNLELLERQLLGTSRKVLRFELGVAESTISQSLKVMLAAMGFPSTPIKVSPVLVLLVHGIRAARPRERLHIQHWMSETQRGMSLVADLEAPPFEELAPAERAVMRQIILGHSYADIAAARRTSTRTVANQIAHACGRLGVSGRLDILQLLVT